MGFAGMYLGIVVLSLVLGLLYPGALSPFAEYSTYVLGSIFLITALQLRVRDILREVRHIWTTALVVGWLLLLLPIVVYVAASALVPEMALALLLLSAMPAGMTAPLLTKIARGKEEFALVLAVVTSLLAPFTVPLVIYLTAGQAISVDVFSMALSLGYVILLPFVLGGVIKKVWPAVREHSLKWSPFSLALLGLLIASLVAREAEVILAELQSGALYTTLGILFVFFILLHIASYALMLRSAASVRVAAVVSLVYMNFTLAIYLAQTYFPEPSVVVPTTLAIVPWALLLPLFALVYRWRR